MDTLVIFPTQPGNEIKRLVGYDTDTRAIWGLATDREHQVLFTSAFFKRHVGLSPEGLGGLFLTDLQSGTTNFWADAFDLGTFFGDEPTGRVLSGLDQASQDPKAYANVSKIGIGDLEYDGRCETLYFVNLWDKKIYSIADVDPDLPPTTSADLVDANGWVVDTAAGLTCTDGSPIRPFGIRVKDNILYATVTCMGEMATATSADLYA